MKSLFFFLFASNTHSFTKDERRYKTMVWKVIKEILKWLLITIIVGFFTWFIRSIYRTIRYGVRGS